MKKFLTNPIVAYSIGGIIIVAAGVYVLVSSKHTPAYTFAAVQSGSITQSVAVTGNVEAAQDVPLEFQKGGTITEIDAKVGDTVTKGQIIAKIDTKDANAAIAGANASVQAARANYNKVLAGATGAQVDVANSAVESANVALQNAQKNQTVITAQQNTAVQNAQSAMFNAGLVAIPAGGNINTAGAQPTISGTYTGTTSGTYTVSLNQTGGGTMYQYSGLENGTGSITTGVPSALGTKGLFITFSLGVNLQSNASWAVAVPNTQSPSYLAAANAYQTALQTQNQALTAAQEAIDSAQAAYDQANAQLNVTVTPARSEDVAAAQAALSAANAQLQAAQNVLQNSIITAPFDGQIGTLTLKVGTTVNANQAIGTLLTSNMYEIDIELSQAEISKVAIGDNANVTFDAYAGEQFAATLASIDSSATMDQNIPVYHATLEFAQPDDRIKAGLSANITILDQTHSNTLIVPSTAIITKNNNTYVLVEGVDNKTTQVQVTTGIQNTDQVEITSGVQAGERVATF